MRRIGMYAVSLGLIAAFAGCSRETQQKTREALDKTGSAIESAAEDAANVTEGAIEGAKEAAEENR